MDGYGITHLDKYKRSENTSIDYAFQLYGASAKQRNNPRTEDYISLRFPIWTF